MSLLDIYAEYEEEIQIRAWTTERQDNDTWGLNGDGRALKTTQAEIDDDYDKIDLANIEV